MRIAGMNVPRGAVRRGFVETSGFADALRVRVPVVVVAGARPGKTLAVVACQHGREVNGPAAAFEALEQLQPRRMRGVVLLFPVANPVSTRQHVQDFPHERGRRLVGAPPNEPVNLNRNWPGDRRGTLPQRIAAALWQAGVAKADAVIDLHSWTDRSAPMAWAAKRHLSLLRAFAFPWSNTASPPPVRGMLEWACNKAGIPCVVCEMTPQDVVNGPRVRYGSHGILNGARALGIIPEEMTFPWARWEVRIRHELAVASKAPGLVVTRHQPGDVIDKGETALKLVDLDTLKSVQTVRPPERMLLRTCGCTWGTGALGYHVVQAGEIIARFAPISREWRADESPF